MLRPHGLRKVAEGAKLEACRIVSNSEVDLKLRGAAEAHSLLSPGWILLALE